MERLREAIEPEAEEEAEELRKMGAGPAGSKYPPFNGQLADGRDIEGLRVEELRAELKARFMPAAFKLKKLADLVNKVWEVVEGEYMAAMEADHQPTTFQQWRQAANANKVSWTDRYDLHQRLLLAAAQGNATGCFCCLEEGADVNYQNERSGQSALMEAAQMGELDCVEVLLWHGADVDLCNKLGQNATMLAGLRRKHRVLQALRSVWRERKQPLTLPTIVGEAPGRPREFEFNDLWCFDDPSSFRRHDGFGEKLNTLP